MKASHASSSRWASFRFGRAPVVDRGI